MKSEQKIIFKKLFEIPMKNGLFKPTRVRGTGTKMINMGEIFSIDRIFDVPMELVPLTDIEEKNAIVCNSDLLFARASLADGAGKCSIFLGNEKTTFESHIIRVRINQKMANPKFYYYFFNSVQGKNLIYSITEKTAASGIRGSDLANLSIPFPPQNIQDKIVNQLEIIDIMLENLQNQNKILEQITQIIFKSWFMDFDGVTEFVDSELGKIPKGWTIESLNENIDFLNGLALQKFRPENKEFLPVIKIKEMKEGFSNKTEKAGLHIDSKYIIKSGDILFSWSGSLELIIWHLLDGALNQHIFKVTSQKYKKWFFYQWIKFHLSEFRRIAGGKRTTMGHIQRHHLSEAKILVPSPKTLKKYDLIIQPIFDQILSNKTKSENLIKIRDILLPKLMSGEIRV